MLLLRDFLKELHIQLYYFSQLTVTLLEMIIVDKQKHLLCIKFNRAGPMNAIRAQMAKDMISVFKDVAMDRGIWVVGLRLTSGKAFGVGADPKERKGVQPHLLLYQHEGTYDRHVW